MPPATRRIMPARIISLWLTISASAGASFRVPMKKRDAFIQKFSKSGARPRTHVVAKAGETGERRNGRRLCTRPEQALKRSLRPTALHGAEKEDSADFRVAW